MCSDDMKTFGMDRVRTRLCQNAVTSELKTIPKVGSSPIGLVSLSSLMTPSPIPSLVTVRFGELDDERKPVVPAAQVVLGQGRKNCATKAQRAEQQPAFMIEDIDKEVCRVLKADG
ncbi:hypothetical protein ON010_g11093 [Phytophthora cinnamomi]|nr:hypothetical protein ON010_g11093 [Phytophthora cinnamomi]